MDRNFRKQFGGFLFAGAAFLAASAGAKAAGFDDPASWLMRGSVTLTAPIALQQPKVASVATPPEEVAAKVRSALGAGDYALASQSAAEMLLVEGEPLWNAGPFGRFAKRIYNVTDKTVEARLSAWVSYDPTNPVPLLVRAAYYRDNGWYHRGQGFISNVSEENRNIFSELMSKALVDISRVLEMAPDNAYAHYQRLELLRTGGMTRAMGSAFKDSAARFPGYLGLYHITLGTLQPKWGGDTASMREFVEAFSGKAPEGSPLKLLEVDLYGMLLNAASISCNSGEGEEDEGRNCVRTFMTENAGPDLEAKAIKALEMFGQLDRYEANNAIRDILQDMVDVPRGDAIAMPMVQAFTDAYRSDTRLRGDADAKNHYLAELLAARSWNNRGFPENALTKYGESLARLPYARFPSERERNEAASDIHMRMATIYSSQNDYPAAAEAARASLRMAEKPYSGLLLCYAQFWMKDYDQAIQSCSRVTEDSENGTSAYYWRGLAYKDSGEGDKALDDLTKVVETINSRRAQAVIEMSMIYFNRNDNKGALELLNRYPFLYDPEVTDKNSVAVGYNNRCYALMELGDLKAALDDCNASLNYGNIPDAFAKRKVLLEKVAAK